MNINVFKLLSSDFALGKIIVLRKAIADSLRLLISRPCKESLRFAKLMLKVKPQYTMLTNNNLITLYELVQRVNELELSGDIVECGVWNGGSAAIMALANMEDGQNHKHRTIWLFDSFQGLPLATEKDGKRARENYFEGWCKGDINKVKQIFAKLSVPLTDVKIISGWFHATLSTVPVKRVSILHIDADWYESVKLVLDVFYEKVVPGGFIILNDYGTWQGCDQALADYFAEHNLRNIVINQVELSGGAYFQKPA